jgi:hypothetical protein
VYQTDQDGHELVRELRLAAAGEIGVVVYNPLILDVVRSARTRASSLGPRAEVRIDRYFPDTLGKPGEVVCRSADGWDIVIWKAIAQGDER